MMKMDITNHVFGKLTAITPVGQTIHRETTWLCRCSCGHEKVVPLGSLRNGLVKSCGCLRHEPSVRIVDRVGQRFGHLTVLRDSTRRYRNGVVWECLCDCGNTCLVRSGALKQSGQDRSCGCVGKSKTLARQLVHGMNGSPTHRSWASLIQRCTNENMPNFHHYGGRGILVCERWRYSFENFMGDMGLRPDGKSIDRIDVDGNYEPTNCRWATQSEQMRNTRKAKGKHALC